MIINKTHLPRRTVLRGLGVSLALPLLDSMVPALTAIGKTAAAFPNLTWSGFLVRNLLPVTIGNILGGAIVVGLAYWFAHLRQIQVVAPAASGEYYSAQPPGRIQGSENVA